MDQNSKNLKESANRDQDENDFRLVESLQDHPTGNESNKLVEIYEILISANRRNSKNEKLQGLLRAYDDALINSILNIQRITLIAYSVLVLLLYLDYFYFHYLPIKDWEFRIAFSIVLILIIASRKLIRNKRTLIVEWAHKFPEIILLAKKKLGKNNK